MKIVLVENEDTSQLPDIITGKKKILTVKRLLKSALPGVHCHFRYICMDIYIGHIYIRKDRLDRWRGEN